MLFTINNKTLYRSSGAHRIATHIRQQGWDCEVVDFVDFWELEELKELIQTRVDEHMKFIGFSFLFNNASAIPMIRDLCIWIKETYPNITLISGGQTMLLDMRHFDYHVAGYGEYALDALLQYLFSNGERPKFDLMRSRSGTKVIDALHMYPAYPFKKPNIFYEKRDFIQQYEWGMIEFTRGCKFKCLYCNYPILGVKEDHTRDTDGVREQMLRNYNEFGIENYIVSDETFNDHSEKIIKYADVIETLPFKPYFTGYIRADLLINRKQDWDHLIRMGFLGHFYGVETFNAKSGKAVGKGMNPERVKEGLIEVKNYFSNASNKMYRAIVAMIGGLPFETPESLNATSEWFRQNWKDQVAMASVLEIANLEKEFRPSDLSLDYAKYGYRPIAENDPRIQNAFSEMIKHSSFGSIAWENDYMDILQAHQWQKEFFKIWHVGKHDLGRLDPFYLSNNLVKDTGELLTLKEKLNLNNKTAGIYYMNVPIFIENYKNNKLSFRG
jgi:hypothetical protein